MNAPLRTIALHFGAAALMTCAQAYGADLPLAVCDSGDFQTVLTPSAGSMPARAVWLDRHLAQWPGVDAGGAFKLYHSPSGTIAAPVNGKVHGAAGALALDVFKGEAPAATAARFKYVGKGVVLAVAGRDLAQLPALHREQLVLVREDADGTVRAATRLQVAGALDDLFAEAAKAADLGVSVDKKHTAFKLWAPTARQAAVCTYDSGSSRAAAIMPMRLDAATGIWSASTAAGMSGRYYK
jgi:hypothetical protein